jgi:hypothetical protein
MTPFFSWGMRMMASALILISIDNVFAGAEIVERSAFGA